MISAISASYPQRLAAEALLPSDRIVAAQETLFRYFMQQVRTQAMSEVLAEFQALFFQLQGPEGSAPLDALYALLINNQESVFHDTFKRCCYILVNYWELKRQHDWYQPLLQSLSGVEGDRYTASLGRRRLKQWLQNFVNDPDFEDLKLYAGRNYPFEQADWSTNYRAYLLTHQSVDQRNPLEQRVAARNTTKRLKQRYKLDLALYTAHSQLQRPSSSAVNPTGLGPDTLRIVKTIVARRGAFSYTDIARRFQQDTKDCDFLAFKTALHRYLIYSLQTDYLSQVLQQQLEDKLLLLYPAAEASEANYRLRQQSVCQVIDWLTTEDGQLPSGLFNSLMLHDKHLTLVVLLLKAVLICPESNAHLESRIAQLIKFYSVIPLEKCQGFIHFLEILRLAFTLYSEDVEYNLIPTCNRSPRSPAAQNLDRYHVFSRVKPGAKAPDLSQAQRS